MHHHHLHQTQPIDMKKTCVDHINRYVLIQTKDGYSYDGIVEHVDDQNVYLAVPIGEEIMSEPMYQPRDQVSAPDQRVEQENPESGERQFYPGFGGYPGYGGFYPGYGYPAYGYPGYGFPRRRRFSPLILPLTAIAALSLLPFY
ncbi:hypothetical protein [Caldalkalibacillus mannanilyticus]|uniref:hypothetical protein n=1 Tax=Caldalkalibacillus mannanilyticus TaxID=1418 RepID=UPI00046939C4|nr:hypothetical protein [Caldalkalibacillus mannanilyticus]